MIPASTMSENPIDPGAEAVETLKDDRLLRAQYAAKVEDAEEDGEGSEPKQ